MRRNLALLGLAGMLMAASQPAQAGGHGKYVTYNGSTFTTTRLTTAPARLQPRLAAASCACAAMTVRHVHPTQPVWYLPYAPGAPGGGFPMMGR